MSFEKRTFFAVREILEISFSKQQLTWKLNIVYILRNYLLSIYRRYKTVPHIYIAECIVYPDLCVGC